MVIKKIHILISGRVQGVSYRYWFQTEANKKKLVGWVRNTTSNRVEAEIIGEKNQVDKMFELCKEGPPLADVKDVITRPIKQLSEVNIEINKVHILKTN